MKLYDFECRTCGVRFEQMVDADTRSLPCPTNACADNADRLLGGKPVFKSSPRRSADDGAVVEVACTEETAARIRPGDEVVVRQHRATEDGCVHVDLPATVLEPPPGEDA